MRKFLPRICLAISFFALIFSVTYLGFRPLSTAALDASLEIPSIGLSTPVEPVEPNGATLTSPDQIAGAYHAALNKTFLIGHSSTVFKNLEHVQIGDQIIYESHTYNVQHIEILAKADISMSTVLAPAEAPTLVIMTCHGEPLGGQDFTHRLIIYAR